MKKKCEPPIKIEQRTTGDKRSQENRKRCYDDPVVIFFRSGTMCADAMFLFMPYQKLCYDAIMRSMLARTSQYGPFRRRVISFSGQVILIDNTLRCGFFSHSFASIHLISGVVLQYISFGLWSPLLAHGQERDTIEGHWHRLMWNAHTYQWADRASIKGNAEISNHLVTMNINISILIKYLVVHKLCVLLLSSWSCARCPTGKESRQLEIDRKRGCGYINRSVQYVTHFVGNCVRTCAYDVPNETEVHAANQMPTETKHKTKNDAKHIFMFMKWSNNIHLLLEPVPFVHHRIRLSN